MGLSLKKIGKGLGKISKMAAPFLPPGFREAAAFGGSVLDGGNIKSHAMNTVGATVGGMIGGRSAGQGIGAALKGGGIKGALSGGLKGGLGNSIKSIGKFAMGNQDLLMGGLSALEGYRGGRKVDGMMDRAMNDPGLNPERPDLSSTFGGYSNPYSMQTRGPAGRGAPVEYADGMAAGIPSIGRRRRA